MDKKKKHTEPLDEKLAQDIGITMSVASATDTTGLFSAMPPAQSGADALVDIVPTHVPIVPDMGDGKIAGKKISKNG